MKTKKIVIGTMAAAMLSLSVCSLIPAAAADDTVQIIAGEAKANAGEQFTVEVKLADIPAAGVQACNFSIEFDNSVISVTSIEAGDLVSSAGSGDPSSSMLPNFNNYIDNNEGSVSIMWSTSLDDASYWLKSGGVLCTIEGKVASDAKAGAKSALKIVPVKRDTTSDSGVVNDKINCGYLKNGEAVAYSVKPTNGLVTVGGADTPTDPNSGDDYLKGDANCDGKVTIADSTAILQHLGNEDKYSLKPQGKINGDCDGEAGITGNDAVRIQMFDAKIIDAL